jgi:hypothetical protein
MEADLMGLCLALGGFYERICEGAFAIGTYLLLCEMDWD